MGLPYGCDAEAAARRGPPAGDDRGPPEELSKRRGRPSSSRSRSSACSPTRWTSSTRCGTTCRTRSPKKVRKDGTGESRGTPGTAAGARRCLAGRHPPHAGLDHGRRATLSAVAGDGGQPNGRPGVGPPTGAGASVGRVAMGGRPSGHPPAGDGRSAPSRRDRGGVRRAATGPAAALGAGRHRVCRPSSGSNTWTSVLESMAQHLGGQGEMPSLLDVPGDGAGAGGQLLRGGGRVLPPEALAARARRHAHQDRVRQVSERALVRGRDGPVRRAAGGGRLRRPCRPPGNDDGRSLGRREHAGDVGPVLDVQRGVRYPRARHGRRPRGTAGRWRAPRPIRW